MRMRIRPISFIEAGIAFILGSVLWAGGAASATPQGSCGFIPNRGQSDPSVIFSAEEGPSTVYCTREGLVIDICERARMTPPAARSRPEALRQVLLRRTGRVIRIRFEDANPAIRIEGEGVREAHMNYVFGRDPSLWRNGVPVYDRVVYRGLWPGVDLVYEAQPGRVACTVRAEPGADVSMVRFLCDGADPAHPVLGSDGSIDLAGSGPGVEQSPTGSFPLDPHLQWSTFLGGTAEEIGWSIALDAQEQPVVTGVTFSSHFPITVGCYDNTYNGYGDVFISKFSADGSRLLWSTFLGGSSTRGFDYGYAITLDPGGNPIVTGYTWSEDFPVTEGAYSTLENGAADAFVTMLDAGGGYLHWSTFLGGEGNDIGYAIRTDSEGNPIIAGRTISYLFPTTPGAYDTTPNGEEDGFVTVLSASGSQLLWSTLLGGSAYDGITGLAIDRDGSPVVAGYTASPDFPSGNGTIGGLYDVFVSKLSSLGDALLWSRVIGGSNYDYCNDVALDSHGDPIVCGETGSSDFPVTAGAYDVTYNGDDDAFVTKLSGTDGAMRWSTFIGGSTPIYETAFGVAVDSQDRPVIAGSTPSSDFPVTQDAYDTTYNGGSDVFVSRLDATGSTLEWSTFLGGSSDDYGWYLTLDSEGRALVVGEAGSQDFPTTAGAYDTTYNGDVGDVFVARLVVGGNPAGVAIPAAIHAPAISIGPNPVWRGGRVILSLSRASSVRIDVIDPAGRRVRRLADGTFAAGASSIGWDGRDDSGRPLPSGRYFLRLSGGEAREIGPPTLLPVIVLR